MSVVSRIQGWRSSRIVIGYVDGFECGWEVLSGTQSPVGRSVTYFYENGCDPGPGGPILLPSLSGVTSSFFFIYLYFLRRFSPKWATPWRRVRWLISLLNILISQVSIFISLFEVCLHGNCEPFPLFRWCSLAFYIVQQRSIRLHQIPPNISGTRALPHLWLPQHWLAHIKQQRCQAWANNPLPRSCCTTREEQFHAR